VSTEDFSSDVTHDGSGLVDSSDYLSVSFLYDLALASVYIQSRQSSLIICAIVLRALFLSDKTLTRARGSVESVNVTRCAQRDISTGGSEVSRALSDVYAMVEDKESV
jgi:hypothetical protein